MEQIEQEMKKSLKVGWAVLIAFLIVGHISDLYKHRGTVLNPCYAKGIILHVIGKLVIKLLPAVIEMIPVNGQKLVIDIICKAE